MRNFRAPFNLYNQEGINLKIASCQESCQWMRLSKQTAKMITKTDYFSKLLKTIDILDQSLIIFSI